MSFNPILKLCLIASLIYVSNALYLRKQGKNTTTIQYIDITTNDYDDHQGGVPDVTMQTDANSLYNNLPWSLFDKST